MDNTKIVKRYKTTLRSYNTLVGRYYGFVDEERVQFAGIKLVDMKKVKEKFDLLSKEKY
jgi:hypothetical protein